MAVWKISPGGRARFWDECRERKCIAINWLNDLDLRKFTDKEDLKKALRKAREKTGGALSILPFVKDIRRGDIVVANDGLSRVVGIGVIEGNYLPPNDPSNPNIGQDYNCQVRLVDWRIVTPVESGKKPFFKIQRTLWSLLPEDCARIKKAYLKEYPELAPELDKLFPEQTPAPPPIEGTMLPLLHQLRQVILYGPPGTGKTRQARRTALAVLEGKEAIGEDVPEKAVMKRLAKFQDEGRYNLVVFHPAYEYEQFVGGIAASPAPGGQQMSFRTEAGTFLKLCRRADENRNQPSVLVIDEINRGLLPKLLGELVYALEYRNDPVTLPFTYEQSNQLIVPENLYIIATMNSSDRSIGHIDVAIRRRFGMFPLGPRPEVVRNMWSKIDEGYYGEQLADLMEKLNGVFKNGNHDGFAPGELGVGHSYFLPAEGVEGDEAKAQVRRKWLYQVQPLLRECAQLLSQGTESLKDFITESLDECLM